ncbi:MAG TPA: MMPL family transporter [Burkholderiales bacterium]|nr:MMPL family transporter [Burkholderiales bacterium]
MELLALVGHTYRRAIVRIVEFCARFATWVVGSIALLTVVVSYYAITHTVLDTDSSELLDPKLHFRILEDQLEKAFPQNSDVIVVMIDGNTPEQANAASQTLIAQLKREKTDIESVYDPEQTSFFSQNGLLYLDKKELLQLSDRLTEAAPFLGTLAQDPSLRGLFTVIGRALDENLSADYRGRLKKMLDSISRIAEAQLAGQQLKQSWRGLFIEGSLAQGNDLRHFFLVKPKFDYTSMRPGQEAVETIRRVAQQLQLDPQHGVRVRLTGDVPIRDDQLASVSRGAGIAVFLSTTMVCLILIAGLRSARLVVAILITLFVGLIWTAAYTAFAIGHLNLISVTFAVLFIGLAVDFGIQFGMRYKEELHRTKSYDLALTETAYGAGGMLTLAAVAAAISFFSFIPTSYRGLAELGVISGMSMFIALISNFTLLPALLKLMPVDIESRLPKSSVLTRLRFPLRRYRKRILIVAALVGAISLALLPRVRFDFNPLNLQDPNTESVSTFLAMLKDPNATPYTIDILAKNLNEANKIAAKVETLPVVDKAVTLDSFVPDDQDEKLAIIADMALVLEPLIRPTMVPPPTPEQERQAFEKFQKKLSEASQKSTDPVFAASMTHLANVMEKLKSAPGWPDQTLKQLRDSVVSDLPQNLAQLRKLLQPKRIELKDIPPDLRERYVAADGQARVEVYPKFSVVDNKDLRRFAYGVQEAVPNASGTPVALVEGGNTVVKACLEATAIALFAALMLLLLVFQSVYNAILVLLPLILAMVVTAASSVILDLPLNLANIIALPLLLGLGIAFGIYLVVRKRSGLDVEHLFRSSTPRAVLFSALTTVASFGSLAFSENRGMSAMGLLLTLALSFALLSTLVVLPAIMSAIESRK